MRIEPTNPFHIARAYQAQQPRPAQAVAPVRPAVPASAPTVEAAADPIAGSIKPAGAPSARLAAAVVPGRVSFAGAEPVHAGPSLPFYTHPADKNAAATAVNAGRSLDIEG